MLNIDGRCLARLKEELTKALQSVQLTNGTYINFRSLGGIFTIPEILPQSGPVRSSINAIFDESNIAEFLLGQLQIEIDDKIEFTPGQEGSLTDLPEFVELEVLASRLVSDFNSLPWRYCVSVRLPDPLSNLFPLEKTRLSGDEQSLFYELQLMGGRSIAKELELLHSTAARGRRNSLVEALARSPNWNAGT
jgi:hypothetical protein